MLGIDHADWMRQRRYRFGHHSDARGNRPGGRWCIGASHRVGADPPEEADDTAAAAAETNETTQTLYLDLEWEVSNPALGFILSQAGYTAVYESNGTIGQNVVRVMDQAGNEGEALINQRAAGSSEE